MSTGRDSPGLSSQSTRCRRGPGLAAFALVCHAAIAAVVSSAGPARGAALPRACGTADGASREPVASDALFVLRRAVGVAGTCGPCLCDANGSGGVGATDALLVLRRAVDGQTPLHCPVCTCRALSLLHSGVRPSSVRVHDVDGDGHLDLVTADLQAGEVSIFRGRGRGVFERRRAVSVDQTPQTVTLVDLDGDGFDDLVTADALPNGLSIRLGGADGEFGGEGRAFFVPTGIAPINVVAGHLDGDDHLDLVVANSLSDDLSVLPGHGDGTFGEGKRIAVGSGPRWIVLARVDEDDVLDAVVANRDSDDLSVLLGNGLGGFGDEHRLAVPDGPYHVSVADLDGDGRSDLVASCIGAGGVAVLLASAQGGFDEPLFYSSQGSAIATDVALVDGDDTPDVVAANYDRDGSPGVAVFLGNGDGTLTPAGYADTQSQPRALAVVDLDGDAQADVVVANADSDTLTILHGAGDGGLLGALESRASSEAGGMLVVDLDEDGLDDAVTTDRHNSVTTQFADGGGRFDRAVLQVNGQPFELGAGDVDGDGTLDIVGAAGPRFVDLVHGHPRGELGARAFALFADGERGFDLAPVSSPVPGGSADEHGFAFGDIDGDGIPDIAVAAAIIELLRGQADGSFQSFGEVESTPASLALVLADVDRDGDNDLLELSRAEHLLSVHRNSGAGTFLAPQRHEVTASWTLTVHDVHGDGAPDLVTTGAYDGSISVLAGDGHGAFAKEVVTSTDVVLYRYAIDDFDGDGAADIATSAEGGVVILPGDGRGRFGASATSSPVLLPTSLPLVDVASGRFETEGPRTVLGLGGVEGPRNRLIVLSHVGDCMVP